MKKSKYILLCSLICLWSILLFGFFTPAIHRTITTVILAAWNKDYPSASTSLRASNPLILANFSALETAIGQDHEFSTGGTNAGKHIQVTFDDPLSQAPTSVSASEGVLYLLDVSAKAELHFEDEDEHTLQLTSGGNLYSSTNFTVAGTSTFTGAVTANGGITLGAGDDLIGSSTSDITFNTNKFTVAGATGNTVIAGTLGVTGVATLGDTSALATSGAPTADAQIANKKYVDDQISSAVSGAGFFKDGAGATVGKFDGSASAHVTAANTWEDVDSGLGCQALIFLELYMATATTGAVKPKDYGSATATQHWGLAYGTGTALFSTSSSQKYVYLVVMTDSSGIFQIASDSTADLLTIKLMGYVK